MIPNRMLGTCTRCGTVIRDTSFLHDCSPSDMTPNQNSDKPLGRTISIAEAREIAQDMSKYADETLRENAEREALYLQVRCIECGRSASGGCCDKAQLDRIEGMLGKLLSVFSATSSPPANDGALRDLLSVFKNNKLEDLPNSVNNHTDHPDSYTCPMR